MGVVYRIALLYFLVVIACILLTEMDAQLIALVSLAISVFIVFVDTLIEKAQLHELGFNN